MLAPSRPRAYNGKSNKTEADHCEDSKARMPPVSRQTAAPCTRKGTCVPYTDGGGNGAKWHISICTVQQQETIRGMQRP